MTFLMLERNNRMEQSNYSCHYKICLSFDMQLQCNRFSVHVNLITRSRAEIKSHKAKRLHLKFMTNRSLTCPWLC